LAAADAGEHGIATSDEREVVMLSVAVVALLAAAGHPAGATFTGTRSDGGTIKFTLSADATRVVSWIAPDVKGDTCQFLAEGDNGVWPGADIDDEAFGYHLYDAISFEGSFTGRLTAKGTMRLFNHQVTGKNAKPACDSGTLTWTASTTSDG